MNSFNEMFPLAVMHKGVGVGSKFEEQVQLLKRIP